MFDIFPYCFNRIQGKVSNKGPINEMQNIIEIHLLKLKKTLLKYFDTTKDIGSNNLWIIN